MENNEIIQQPDTELPAIPPAHIQLKTRFIPVSKWNEHHQWPPVGGLRHLIFFAEKNGFHKVIKRCGRRVLIDESAFFNWMEEQNSKKVHGGYGN